jgi:hypothetical protein
MAPSLEEAERIVREVFAAEFPKARYADWNAEIDDEIARNIVGVVGCASIINVATFIERLWWRSVLQNLGAISQSVLAQRIPCEWSKTSFS